MMGFSQKPRIWVYVYTKVNDNRHQNYHINVKFYLEQLQVVEVGLAGHLTLWNSLCETQ